MTILLAFIGLVLLIVGADLLVRGASTLAAAVGISPLVVGLTVVAFGTSAPELAVSIKAALAHEGDVAMGNVVGSNIMNVLLILGMSAVIAPLLVNRQLILLDVPVMIAAAIAVFMMAKDGEISQIDGAILVAMLLLYMTVLIVRSRRENIGRGAAESTPKLRGSKQVILNLIFMISGLAMLVFGADWLVNGAVALANALHVDQLVISLTIVAIGTSLPETATSLMATWRGQRDIAVGNVVGSNIFNLLSIVGIASIVQPLDVSNQLLRFDLPIMLIVCIACWPIFWMGRRIMRVEGVVFLLGYISYTVYLVLRAGKSGALPQFEFWMTVAILPLLGVGMLAAWLVEHRASSRRVPEASLS